MKTEPHSHSESWRELAPQISISVCCEVSNCSVSYSKVERSPLHLSGLQSTGYTCRSVQFVSKVDNAKLSFSRWLFVLADHMLGDCQRFSPFSCASLKSIVQECSF
uniref:Uncharacterized protein n=1 Tax=Rhipicephalus zambeziensis TaxID=60191 RepID=A0A224YGI8_9ACAR